MGACCSRTKNLFTRNHKNARDGLYEPLLQETERDAVEELTMYLQEPEMYSFSDGRPLNCLSTLSYSDSTELQRLAALAFLEATESDPVLSTQPANREFLLPLLYLLRSTDTSVLKSAAMALANLTTLDENKTLVLQLSGLDPVISALESQNTQILTSIVGVITNLTTLDQNKSIVARSSALRSLVKLAKHTDYRVARNSVGAILNLTHTPADRNILVQSNVFPTLTSLINSSDAPTVYYALTALSNIAVDASSRARLTTMPNFSHTLISLLSNPISLTSTCLPMSQEGISNSTLITQVILCLRNLASDTTFQRLFLQSSILTPLTSLMQSILEREDNIVPPEHRDMLTAICALLRNLSILPESESAILSAPSLPSLILQLTSKTNDPNCLSHLLAILRNLLSSEQGKSKLFDMGLVDVLVNLIDSSPPQLSEILACLAMISLVHDMNIKASLIDSRVLPLIIKISSSSTEVNEKANAAAAIANLARGVMQKELWKPFVEHWNDIAMYVEEFLEYLDEKRNRKQQLRPMLQYIAVWTLLQLCENDTLRTKIKHRFLTKLESIRSIPRHSTHTPQRSKGHGRDTSISSARSLGSVLTNNTIATTAESAYGDVKEIAGKCVVLLMNDNKGNS